jgi:hypothetical protein
MKDSLEFNIYFVPLVEKTHVCTTMLNLSFVTEELMIGHEKRSIRVSKGEPKTAS